MNIKSTIPISWPQLGVSLKEGDNEINEASLPKAAHERLALLAKAKVIDGYAPNAEFVRAAEQFATGKASSKAPPVAPPAAVASAPEPAAPADTAHKRR